MSKPQKKYYVAISGIIKNWVVGYISSAFIGLVIVGYELYIIPCSTSMVSVRVNFGEFYIFFSLVFYDFRGVFYKTIVYSHLLDMKRL